MTMIRVERDEATPTLMVMVERLGDFTDPFTAILEDALLCAQQQVVEGKGAAFGRPAWPLMAEETIRHGRDPATLLVDSGDLLLSLARGGDGNVFEVGPDAGVAGTALVAENGFAYPYWQQYGTARYPARPYLDWYEERFEAYDLLLGEHIIPEA